MRLAKGDRFRVISKLGYVDILHCTRTILVMLVEVADIGERREVVGRGGHLRVYTRENEAPLHCQAKNKPFAECISR